MKPELISVTQGKAEYRLTQDHPLRIAHAAGGRLNAWTAPPGLPLMEKAPTSCCARASLLKYRTTA
jgi:hypothetical protein